MAEIIDIPAAGPPVDSYIKGSRHGESLWLNVRNNNRLKQSITGRIDNDPICWPYSSGDVVEIDFDEVIAWLPANSSPNATPKGNGDAA